MALDYEQSSQLRTNMIFRGRIASAALKWADSIFSNNSFDLTASENRRSVIYAGEIFKNVDWEATRLQPAVVQDPAVQAQNLDEDGDSQITDPYLQSSVESAIKKIL